jgi:putative transposase
MLDDSEEDVLAFMAFLKAQRKLASTNPLERINSEIKCRTDVVGIFPNDAPTVQLVCSSRATNGSCSGDIGNSKE